MLLYHQIAFTIVGEDPQTTILKWIGPAHGTLLQADASTLYRISRLTFDGSGIADTAENFMSSGSAGAWYSTWNQLSDQHIVGFSYGMRLPYQAETGIERVFFDHLTTYAVSMEGWNTDNVFINDSLFVGNGTGITNLLCAGNIIVSNSFFAGSTTSDISIQATGYFTARHNTSVGSHAFFTALGIGANPAAMTLQNNTILDPLSTPFVLGNLGPLMLIDNTVRFQQKNIPYLQAEYDPTVNKDVFSIGNTYTPNAGAETQGGSAFEGVIESYDDRTIDVASIPDVAIPSNVYVPPNPNRPVFEPAVQTGQAIQDAILLAAQSGVPNAVVHLSPGTYQTSETLAIPFGSQIQLIGDGPNATAIMWTGTGAGPVISIPDSNTSIRMLRIEASPGASRVDGADVMVADQPSSQVIVDQAQFQTDNQYSVNFDGVEHLTAELTNTYVLGTVTGLSATGGPFRNHKVGAVGITNHYSGSIQSTGDSTSFNVTGYGKLMIQDNWHDNGATSPNNFVLSGGGTVTEQTGEVAMDSATPFVIGNFDGNISLIGLSFTGGFALSPGQSKTNLLTLGLNGGSASYSPQSVGNLTVNNILDGYYSGGGVQLPATGKPSAQWMRMMLAQSRTEYPIQRSPMTQGASRVRFDRVWFQDNASAIHLLTQQPETGLYYTLSAGGAPILGAASCPNASAIAVNGQWTLRGAGDGDFVIVAGGGSNQVLAVQTGNGASNVAFAAETDDYTQRWLVQNVGDGHFQLLNRATGLYVLPNGAQCPSLAESTSEATNLTLTAH